VEIGQKPFLKNIFNFLLCLGVLATTHAKILMSNFAETSYSYRTSEGIYKG